MLFLVAWISVLVILPLVVSWEVSDVFIVMQREISDCICEKSLKNSVMTSCQPYTNHL